MKKKINFWNNPWTVKIGGGVVVLLIGLSIADVWGKVLKLIGDVFNWIWLFFTGEIKTNLIVLILVFLSGIFLSRISNFIKNKFKDDLTSVVQSSVVATQPDFVKYIEDTFDNMLYRWSWVKNNSGIFMINNIVPFCPKCKCRLVAEGCPVCKISYYGRTQSFAEVEAIVHQRIESGLFKNIIAAR